MAAGIDVKVVSERLGIATTAITADDPVPSCWRYSDERWRVLKVGSEVIPESLGLIAVVARSVGSSSL